MRIAMIGATGLIGRQLWPLLEARHELLVLGRRPSGATCEKLGRMDEWPALLAGERLDCAISTLGTTWKKTGSWEKFAAVDRDAVLAFARAAHAAGARHFLAVSSSGADPASRNAYLRLKGEVEEALGARLILRGSLERYAGIDAGLVARGMAALAEQSEPGLFRHHNREIRTLALS